MKNTYPLKSRGIKHTSGNICKPEEKMIGACRVLNIWPDYSMEIQLCLCGVKLVTNT